MRAAILGGVFMLSGCTLAQHTGNYRVTDGDLAVDLSTLRATEITIERSPDGTERTHIKPSPLSLGECADVLTRLTEFLP